ncbi:MAG: hypothetical protein ACQEP8_02700, partial [Chlamydiota bacterium]
MKVEAFHIVPPLQPPEQKKMPAKKQVEQKVKTAGKITSLFGGVSKLYQTARPTLYPGQVKNLAKVGSLGKFISVLSAPFEVLDLYDNVSEQVKSARQLDSEGVIYSAWAVIGNVGGIISKTMASLSILTDINVIPSSVIAWAAPLGAVGVVLSTGDIVKNTLSLVFVKKLSKSIDKSLGERQPKDIEKTITMLNNKKSMWLKRRGLGGVYYKK